MDNAVFGGQFDQAAVKACDGSFYNIGFSDKAGDKLCLRAFIDFLCGPDLFDDTIVHNSNAVAHGQGFLLIMGHVDKGNAELFLQVL